MSPLTRRALLAHSSLALPAGLLSAALPPGAFAAAPKDASVLLLHDPSLAAGRRFAARAQALGQPSLVLSGDPIRLARTLLATRPGQVFAISQEADRLLFIDAARELGYDARVRIGHRTGCLGDARCGRAPHDLAALTRASGPLWPEAFAHYALGAMDTPPRAQPHSKPQADRLSSVSWVLHLRG
ncbi:hypothetical protein MTR62_03665 [Novosphingobium sp. 1949]|uniref:Uncharacterized protein n=1 Tax=Novosphingobium organovorum TaxID=2930092 RepID=A0ABT0B9R4_9SPHN|nr:hypothetical protein [Novosphingobium organovorum]MCJ2181806.1 hypothetical protein [Novosphingobium organovorum]